MTVFYKIAKSPEDCAPSFVHPWGALSSRTDGLEGYKLFRSENGGSLWEEYLIPLMSADEHMELNHVNDDLAWAVKTWEERDPYQRVYLFEVHARDEHSPVPTYFRDKSTDFAKLTERLVRILTDEEFRKSAQQNVRHSEAWWVR